MLICMKLTISIIAILIIIFAIGQFEAKPVNKNEFTTDKSLSRNHKEVSEYRPKNDSAKLITKPIDVSRSSIIQSERYQINTNSTDNSGNVTEQKLIDSVPAEQNFYPLFLNPFPPSPFPIVDESLQSNQQNFPNRRSFDTSILGSGEFSVMRGGTFYPDNEQIAHDSDTSNQFNQFFPRNVPVLNNGNVRPEDDSYLPRFTYPEEQFANFRDFAEINAPSDSAYSQFTIVYANENSTQTEQRTVSQPKNIFEQLELLDKEKSLEEKKNRIKKVKIKLENTKLEKNYKKHVNPKDISYEPLLALS